ncbi:aquaporin [Mycoplasmopsis felifaucium]|uniref:aquaporin n=1 Tax=Mycoplasmopsis felifaucium TaxID=35768 RepID=UPI00068FC252|nr:aquaporin [Mycoplasmopsis felifaucium]
MFNFFKFSKKTREHAEQPKNGKTWTIHMLSELFGTIFISLGLAGLSLYVNGKALEHWFLLHNIIVGFFAGFIIVGACLFIFLRWSCDLNPAVTIYRWFNGTNTSKYAIAKIAIQMVGAVVAGLIIYGLGLLTNGGNASNAAISAANSANKDFLAFNNTGKQALIGGSLWIFFGEMVMTAVLLFPIFSPRIDSKYRDVMILFIISLSVWLGILLGSAAINPARGLAQQVPDLFFGFKTQSTASKYFTSQNMMLTDLLLATFMMMLGDICAPFFYALVQGFTEKYFVNFVNNTIAFKNNKRQNMISNFDLEQAKKNNSETKNTDSK